MIFSISELNYDCFAKKINSIKRKCEKYKFPFHFDIKGENFKVLKDSTFTKCIDA